VNPGMDDAFEVEVQGVTRSFGDAVAVDRVSLEVRRGEFLTLLGPSGCGKTTLLRIIGGFETPDEGRVILGGNDVTETPPYRRDVTTVFQQYALFPHLNVFRNVTFGLERRRITRAEVERRTREALDLVRLSGTESRRPSELSGGQQQRVALARALVLEPRVLLLEEPLAALDLKLRKQMQLELKSIQRRVGISFIYVTHDQEEALTMSDRIVVMNAGRIEQVGNAAEIYERPATEFVADFIGVSNIVEGTVEEIAEGLASIRVGNAKVAAKCVNVVLGESVRLMIRPEKIRVVEEIRAESLAGRIESAIYLGESTQWIIALEDGRRVTALEQNREPFDAREARLGRLVSIGWEPEAAVVLNR